MPPDDNSDHKLWINRPAQPSNPSSSTTNPQLHHVTPVRHSQFSCVPFRPQSIRTFPDNTNSLQPPDRPSPPSPSNTRQSRWTPIRRPPFDTPEVSTLTPIPTTEGSTPRTPIGAFNTSTPLVSPAPLPTSPVRSLPRSDYPMESISPTPPRSNQPSGPFASIRLSTTEFERGARARVNRQTTPRPSAWTVEVDGSSGSASDGAVTHPSDISELALTHTSMEIDGIFQNTDFVGSDERNESTSTWVKSARRQSVYVSDYEDCETTLVDIPKPKVAGGTKDMDPVSDGKRRSSLPIGDLYDGQGDRLAVPSAGPTGRKRELSGGSNKSRHSETGSSAGAKRKRRKRKGKGKAGTSFDK